MVGIQRRRAVEAGDPVTTDVVKIRGNKDIERRVRARERWGRENETVLVHMRP